MKASSAGTRPLILTSRDEEILRALHQYRYMTAEDMAYLLFSPKSIAYVRRRLSRLSGNADFHTHTYLCRFPLPKVGLGRPEKIFTLGVKGRDFLQRVWGLPVDWHFRPYKLRHLGFSHLVHALLQTRVVVAAQYWSRKQANYTLTHTRMSYELARNPATVEVDAVDTEGKAVKLTRTVIPDAWLFFERTDGAKFPILLEIDRGMEYQQKFKQHVKARIEFIRTGQYAKLFHLQEVMIAYVTTGQTPEYRESRRKGMCNWTKEVLEEMNLKNWAEIFRFHSLVLDTIYEQSIFEKPDWYRLDSSTPIMLFPA
jgi:hypothetical protein